jgi:hypothetical protein
MIKITFGIIALNAKPLLEYNLRALYPFAHQIIVVEGATRAAASLATEDGHSSDNTLQMLKQFQSFKDPEKKLELVSAKEEGYADGFWPEKDEMSRAYAKRATGDWLWQVDGDEFYRQEDMREIIAMLEREPDVTAVSFPYHEFFGSFSSVITGKWHLSEHPRFHRLFRWKKGYRYQSHRPPTVLNEKGVDLRKIKWISSPMNNQKPIFLFHYSYVFPKQAKQKVGYYSNVSWTEAFRQNQTWLETSYYGLRHPFFLSEKGWPILQWLEKFSGKHPEVIEDLQSDLAKGTTKEDLRATKDIDRLLSSALYVLATRILRFIMPTYWVLRRQMRRKKFSTP